ncbi:right-handed parallel beta-helix repeat-containing protein [Phenylobacterium sp.]|uniref:right-handed parallel beta-helix repeat-containing protein n=1 Tax=Phenylobacterium sp. TaxID=1871053 RepID=UPI0025FE8B17|nr:right-handed parallel beta-helix repeat-containing protein [Phenylobacterium sp.]
MLVANSSQLSAVLASAKGGDVIRLAPGNYGDVSIAGMTFATDVTITSADPAREAVLRSLTVAGSSGLSFSNLTVNFTPNAATTTYSSAVKISASSDISFSGGTIKGGGAVTGVPRTAADTDSTGNVLGLPTARAVSIERSSDVRIDGNDISSFFKGVVLYKVSGVAIRGNHIEDMRTGMVTGAEVSRMVVDGNTLSSSHPWNWGKGDHADFIHFWTNKSQGAASTDIRITNNHIEQGDGIAILGIYLDDNGNNVGFRGVEVSGNVLLNGNSIGVRLENTSASTIRGNVFLQTPGEDNKPPGIYLTDKTHHVTVVDNILGFITDVQNTNAGHIGSNTIAQPVDASLPGYYDSVVLETVADLTGSAAVNYVLGALGDGEPVVATDVTADQKLAAKSNADTPLRGGLGNDTLVGLGGNDTLNAGEGNDLLTGRGGNDHLIGGGGADRFVFAGSYIGRGGTDLIADFSRADGDRINVHSIDANSLIAGDHDFRFLGAGAFTRNPGELRYEAVSKTEVRVMGDLNGDGVADFAIRVVGVGTMTASDFIL